jgi:hypothetical protein
LYKESGLPSEDLGTPAAPVQPLLCRTQAQQTAAWMASLLVQSAAASVWCRAGVPKQFRGLRVQTHAAHQDKQQFAGQIAGRDTKQLLPSGARIFFHLWAD